MLWLNYPNNPTAATAPLDFYERAAALAREHDFVLASDEAYSELYFGEPPVSVLEVADRTNVLAFNTLSKRSSMPGYRSGFMAGDPELIAALKHYRPNVGVAPQEFIQRAAVAAWGDEAHVEEVRERYRAKRDVLLPVLERAGLRHAGGDATFFLWLDAGAEADALAERWLEAGVVVAPGSFFGPEGERLPAPRARAVGGRLRARGQRAGGAVVEPRRRLLDLGGEREQAGLRAQRAGQLDADREPALVAMQRERDRRLAGDVERAQEGAEAHALLRWDGADRADVRHSGGSGARRRAARCRSRGG